MIGRFRVQESAQKDVRPVEKRSFDDFDVRLGDVMRGERATLGKSLLDVQRELKIKATYIAAIENADPSAFETPGFIAGYVRSYARYLALDPEWAYKTFCAEGEFATAHGMSSAASATRSEARSAGRASAAQAQPGLRDPFSDPAVRFAPRGPGVMAGVQPGAIGSILVLAGLIGVIGYGGYAVLSEIQKVQFVPVEQTPDVVAQLDPVSTARIPPKADEAANGTPAVSDGFDRLYRPEALDVPVLVARDGPIAGLDPRRNALPSPTPAVVAEDAGTQSAPVLASAEVAEEAGPDDGGTGIQVVTDAAPGVALLAVRTSWVRVRAADGTVLLEKTMSPCERFVLPLTEEPPTLRTGESGAIYFAVNGLTYGPAGRSGQVTSNLALAADTLVGSYAVADLERDGDLARMVAALSTVPADITAPDCG